MKRIERPHLTACASLSLDGRLLPPTERELQLQTVALARFDTVLLDGVPLTPLEGVTSSWLSPLVGDIKHAASHPGPGIFFISRTAPAPQLPHLQIAREKKDVLLRLSRLYREFAARHLLCPLGSTVLSALISHDLVDEIHFNLHPEIQGGRRLSTLTGRAGPYLPASTRWRLAHLIQNGDHCGLTYLRV